MRVFYDDAPEGTDGELPVNLQNSASDEEVLAAVGKLWGRSLSDLLQNIDDKTVQGTTTSIRLNQGNWLLTIVRDNSQAPDKNGNNNCLRGFECPKCGNHEILRIQLTTCMRMADDGEDGHGELEYNDESYCDCPDCAYHGTVKDFYIRS